MNVLLASALALDATGQVQDMYRLLREKAPLEVGHQVYQLLTERRFLEAYFTAKLFSCAGMQHPVLQFARSIGGYLFNSSNDETSGAAALSDFVQHASAEQQGILFRAIVQPVIEHVVMRDASVVHDHDKALRLLEVLKAGSADFHAMFDWDAEAPPLDPAAIGRQAAERAKLMRFADPPSGISRRPVRAVVAMRELVFPGLANSRSHDMGPRVVAAMNGYGWHAVHYPMKMIDYVDDMAGILATCEREQADLLVLDDDGIISATIDEYRRSVIARLREVLPAVKVVASYLDPWMLPEERLIEAAVPVDAIWTPFPSMPVWRHPALAPKMVFVPMPHAGQGGLPQTPLPQRMSFIGGVFGYNWHRAFWVAGTRRGVPLDFQSSSHQVDGMSVLDSYAAYMQRVANSGCSVNFSMRPNLSRILTGRFFETLLAGALLVQEETPDMEYYLVPGEHFLPFRTVPELRAIARFLVEAPDEAEAIRQRGNAFARTHYNDDRLIGYLDQILFHPAAASAPSRAVSPRRLTRPKRPVRVATPSTASTATTTI